MLHSEWGKTELEKRIQNQNNFDSFGLMKKLLIKLQEITLSIWTNETTEVIWEFDRLYTMIESWTDVVVWNDCRWDYRVALFQMKGSDNYLFRVEEKIIVKNGWNRYKNYNYPLIGRKRYDIFRSELASLIRSTRPSEYQSAKSAVFYDITQQLWQISLSDLLVQVTDK